MTGFWTDDYWGPHTPGPNCPCEPKLVEQHIPAFDETGYPKPGTDVFGLRHRGVTEEISRKDRSYE
jgi:hypothetical protein